MMDDVTLWDNVVSWLLISLGVLIAVVLPALAAFVKSNFGVATAGVVDWAKYLRLGAFCALTAVLLLAIYRAAEPDAAIPWSLALLLGYSWEATIEKLSKGL